MTRTPVFGCAVALVAAVLTGCQSQSGDLPPPITQPKQSAPAGPPAPQLLPDVDLPDNAAELAEVMGRQIQTAGSVRFSASTTTKSTKGTTGSLELTGVVRKQTSGQPAAATLRTVQTGGSDAGATETIVIGDTVYTRVEGEEHAPGKPWLRIRPQDLTSADLGPTREGFQEVYDESIKAAQEAIAGTDLAALANGKVTKDPTEVTLDAVTVQRYTGETDTKKLADEAGDAQLRELARAGARRVPWTIWVDAKGLPRQFTMTMTIPRTGTITSRANYSGWGDPLTVAAPPAPQVATLTG